MANDVLTAMLETLSKEQTESEEQVKTLTLHVEEIKARRLEVERLLAWKPGDPVMTLALTTPITQAVDPAKTANGAAHPGEDPQKWVGDILMRHGKKFVRSEVLKAEFPHINFQVLFGRKLITAKGFGRGREYKLR